MRNNNETLKHIINSLIPVILAFALGAIIILFTGNNPIRCKIFTKMPTAIAPTGPTAIVGMGFFEFWLIKYKPITKI